MTFTTSEEATMKSMVTHKLSRIAATLAAVTALLALAVSTATAAASPNSAFVTGGRADGSGYYRYGVKTSGSVTDTRPDGACVHADVKLALSGYTDYTWKEATACGYGVTRSWNSNHIGPILSAFSMSVVQGVYMRVCRERNNWADECSGWVYIGR